MLTRKKIPQGKKISSLNVLLLSKICKKDSKLRCLFFSYIFLETKRVNSIRCWVIIAGFALIGKMVCSSVYWLLGLEFRSFGCFFCIALRMKTLVLNFVTDFIWFFPQLPLSLLKTAQGASYGESGLSVDLIYVSLSHSSLENIGRGKKVNFLNSVIWGSRG